MDLQTLFHSLSAWIINDGSLLTCMNPSNAWLEMSQFLARQVILTFVKTLAFKNNLFFLE